MSDEEFLLAVRGAYSYIEAQSDLDKYKAQIRAEVIDELMKIASDGEKRNFLWCEVLRIAEQLKEQK